MIFKRKIYDKLLEWKKMSGGTSAVMLEGARRIGKSTIAENFAQNEYKDYFIIDFAKANKDIKSMLVDYKNTRKSSCPISFITPSYFETVMDE